MQDELVPAAMSKRLYDTATAAKFKQLLEIPNGCHNQTWLKGGDEYFVALKGFFERCEKENN